MIIESNIQGGGAYYGLITKEDLKKEMINTKKQYY